MCIFPAIQALLQECKPGWVVRQSAYAAAEEGGWETLLTLCNGYVGIRGALELPSAGRQPASYFAGVFDKPDRPEQGTACGLKLLNKAKTPALANAPVFNSLEIEVDGGMLDFLNCEVVQFERSLDLARGLLLSCYGLRDRLGRTTRIRTLSLVSLPDPHAFFTRLEIEAADYSGKAVVRFCNRVDPAPGYIPRLRDYISRTECVAADAAEGLVYLDTRVVETGVQIALASRTTGAQEPQVERRQHGICEVFAVDLACGRPAAFHKQVSLFTSLDGPAPREAAFAHLQETLRTEDVDRLGQHTATWADRWELADVAITGDDEVQLGIRWDLFSLIQLGSRHSADVSIGATGLHGQGYFGHVFWDTEIFMLPFYQATDLSVARNLLLYRYHRLDAARQNAMDWGFKGARFPWTSTWKGFDVTPQDWGSRLELHISGDVAVAFQRFFEWTGDVDFYKQYAVEVIVETAKFWASRVVQGEDGKFHLLGIVGPDEYHRNADDNYFSNYLAAWNMRQAIRSMAWLRGEDGGRFAAVAAKTGWDDALRASLEAHATRMFFPRIRGGVCEQQTGYFEQEDVPPLQRGRYNMPVGGEHAYGKNTQMNKQADVVMMHYLFPEGFDSATVRASYEYYDRRCIQGSSLSPAIFCIQGLKAGLTDHSYGYFQATALLDLLNLHLDKNLHEGVHAACAGGTWMAALYGYGGVSVQDNELALAPQLPEPWTSLAFGLLFRGRRLKVSVTRENLMVRLVSGESLTCRVYEAKATLEPGREVTWRRPARAV